MNYTQLVGLKTIEGSIRNWVNNDTVPTIDILKEAQDWIYERLRVREMVVTATGSMTISQDYVTEPTRFLAPIHFQIVGAYRGVLVEKTAAEVEAGFSYDGSGARVNNKPTMFHVAGARLQFNHPADIAYSYRLVHYAQLTDLAVANETNFLTERYGRLLRCACLAFATEFMDHSEASDRWLAKAEQMIAMHKQTADMDRAGMQTDSYVEAE